jgi:hypothetical protein
MVEVFGWAIGGRWATFEDRSTANRRLGDFATIQTEVSARFEAPLVVPDISSSGFETATFVALTLLGSPRPTQSL